MALSYDFVNEMVTHMLDFVVENAKQPAPVVDVTKLTSPVTGPNMPVSKDEEWVEDMANEIKRLEAKYVAKYKFVEEGGVLHSSPVAIPRLPMRNSSSSRDLSNSHCLGSLVIVVFNF